MKRPVPLNYEEAARRWRRRDREQKDRQMVANVRAVKTALRAAGLRMRVSPSPVYGARYREVIVEVLEHHEPLVTCACGRSYTYETWHALRLVGTQPALEDVPELELRDCLCGSTIGREVHR